jgi:hypothetical protein
MMVRSGNPAVRLATLITAALMLLMGAGATGWAQSAPPSLGLQEQGPQAPPPPSTPSPAPSENPGLINEMGKLFDKLPSILPPIKSPSIARAFGKPRADQRNGQAVRQAALDPAADQKSE